MASTLPHLTRHVRSIIRLMELTGARPGEVCRLKLSAVDRTGPLWIYRPGEHKTAHHGKDRAIPLGPRAQAVIVEFLRGGHPPPDGWAGLENAGCARRVKLAAVYKAAGRLRDADILRDTARPFVLIDGCVVDPTLPLFNPYYDREERFQARRSVRKTKVQPSQRNRRKVQPKRVPAHEYTPGAVSTAVARAAEKAEVPHWHPNQLRHTYATAARARFGLEAVQVALGHARADITQVYAERNLTLAAKVAGEIG